MTILTAIQVNTPDAALLAVLGYAVVFFGLSLLMCVVYLIGRIFIRKAAKQQAADQAAQAAYEAELAAKASVNIPVAPGSAGQLKLHDVEPKTAAMLMAIVADKLGKPLNELRFISIKEVK